MKTAHQKPTPRILLILSLGALVISSDQATKALARKFLAGNPPKIYLGDLFRLQYAENAGSFLSLGAGLSENTRYWILSVLVSVALLALAYFVFRRPTQRMQTVNYSLILAGGIGNLIDRFDQGRVTDFINMGIGPLRTGIFNVADIAITAGVALLLLDSFRREKDSTTSVSK